MKIVLPESRFDVEFTTDPCDHRNNAELTLKLRIGFRQINPAGGAAQGTHNDYGDPADPARRTIRWTDAAWAHWKKTFEREVERFWSGKFWLINPGSHFAFDDKGKTWIPNVWCRFDLTCRDATQGSHHHIIDVVRLHRSESWFGSHSTLYDSNDLKLAQKATDSQGNQIMQRAHVHEVGHLIGLGHVAEGTPQCPHTGDTNASACYGTTDQDLNAVMGSGMQLRIDNAAPWQQAMRRVTSIHVARNARSPGIGLMTGTAALFQPWTAKMSRHYPRTQAELAAGTLVTAR